MNDKRTTLEVIAANVEEAIEQGLDNLRLPREAVDVEILDEGKQGLFGIGARQARVRLIVKDQKPQTAPAAAARTLETPAIARPADRVQTAPPVAQPQSEIIDPGQAEDNVLEIARNIVAELLERMRVRADVSAYFEKDQDPRSQPTIWVDIHGDDLSILIGRQAETLNALQYIASLIAGKELGRSIPMVVDVEGFRKRRENQLRQLAMRVAEQVVQTGRSQPLEPMSSSERRLVHIALRDHAEVYTESTGDGGQRKVVILPKS